MMPTFRYVAIDPSGQTARGVMEADNEAEVIARLQKSGNLPIRAEPATGSGFLSGLMHMEFGRGGLSRQDVADVTRELSIMLSTGQDIDRALRFIVETAPNARIRKVMDEVRSQVRDGRTLADALSRQSSSFSRLYVGLVRAGEAGASLAQTLDRLAVLLERERSLAATIKTAMVYPTLLVIVAVGSITLLLTQVLPQFVPLFEQNGVALPAATQFMIDAGAVLSNYGVYLVLTIAIAILAVRQLLRSPGPRLFADRTILRLPIAGSIAKESMAARFTRTLGTLIINGVPLITALTITRDAVGNLAGVQAIERATASAKGGAGLSRPLEESGIFPARTIHLLRLGEETAQLGQMSLRAAEIHEESTRLGIQRMVALLVPVITILMGAAVAAIVSSLLLAMLSLNDLAQ